MESLSWFWDNHSLCSVEACMWQIRSNLQTRPLMYPTEIYMEKTSGKLQLTILGTYHGQLRCHKGRLCWWEWYVTRRILMKPSFLTKITELFCNTVSLWQYYTYSYFLCTGLYFPSIFNATLPLWRVYPADHRTFLYLELQLLSLWIPPGSELPVLYAHILSESIYSCLLISLSQVCDCQTVPSAHGGETALYVLPIWGAPVFCWSCKPRRKLWKWVPV